MKTANLTNSLFTEYKILSGGAQLLFSIYSNADQRSIMDYLQLFQIEIAMTITKENLVEYINANGIHTAYDSFAELLRCENDLLTFKLTKEEEFELA